ncbi:MAG: carboxypeptidase-like regulatory domain-containing protein [Patescibacteria group bacterium]|jgi:hypothetical protein
MSKFYAVVLTLGLLSALPVLATDTIYNHDIVNNGNFENELDSWTCDNCNEDDNIVYDEDYSTHYLRLGSANETEEAKQTVTLAADVGNVELSYDCDFHSTDTTAMDNYYFSLQDHTTHTTYLSDIVYPTDDVENCLQSYDLTQYAGKTLDLVFGVNNDETNTTTVSIDNVVVTEKSYSQLTGRVLDAEYNKIKKAKVTIKKDDGTLLWTGKTDKKGLFTATHLAADDYKLHVIVKKGELKKTFHTYVEWGTSYNKIYRFK